MYKRIGDANKAILSIKPRVTLAQANLIEELADSIAEENTAGAWPLALTQFRRLYTVRGGQWIERRKLDKTAEDNTMPQSLTVDVDGEQVAITALVESYRTLQEQKKYKTIGGEKFAAEIEPSENGAMVEPVMIGQGPISFADLLARKQAREAADEVCELTYQFQMLANNVMASSDLSDKLAALKELSAEYLQMVGAALAMVGAPEPEGEGDEPAAESQPPAEPTAQADLAESESGQAVSLVEVADGPPAVVDVEIIQPGWGNARDNHYYPADVLARDAGVFKGAKMYATDHRPEQKSVLTEVSTILDIVGFSERGAPIARVGIHNPEFAADVRNRAKLGVLNELHCSILARGTAKDYADGERKGKLVESITAVQSVDWVTRAGAGGHAVALVESANEQTGAEGGDPVGVQEIKTEEGQIEVTEAQPVIISEAEQPPAPVAPTESAPQETWLNESDVTAELSKRPALHSAIKARVTAGRYRDLAEFNAALAREIDYYKELTGSGSPFAQGAQHEQPLSEAEREKRKSENFNRIMREIGMREV